MLHLVDDDVGYVTVSFQAENLIADVKYKMFSPETYVAFSTCAMNAHLTSFQKGANEQVL